MVKEVYAQHGQKDARENHHGVQRECQVNQER
jgi:hypothetical protein